MKPGRILFGIAVLTLAVLAVPAMADSGPGAVPSIDFDNLHGAEVMAGDCDLGAEVADPAPEQPQVTEADLFQGAEEKQILGGGNCNEATCSAGQFCCNYSCSTCAPLGGYCTQQICPPTS